MSPVLHLITFAWTYLHKTHSWPTTQSIKWLRPQNINLHKEKVYKECSGWKSHIQVLNSIDLIQIRNKGHARVEIN